MSTLVAARTGSRANPERGAADGPQPAGLPAAVRPGEVVETWLRSRSGSLLARVQHPQSATAAGAVLLLPPTQDGPDAPGAAAPQVEELSDALARHGYVVVRADWAGAGESGQADLARPTGVRRLDDVGALTRFVRSELGVEDIHLVGLGTGGAMAALAIGDPYHGPVDGAHGPRSGFRSALLVPDGTAESSPATRADSLPTGKSYTAWQTRLAALIPARGPRSAPLERFAGAASATLLRVEDPRDARHVVEWVASEDPAPTALSAWRPQRTAPARPDGSVLEDLLTLGGLPGVLTRGARPPRGILVLLAAPGGSRRQGRAVASARQAAPAGLATLRLEPPPPGTDDAAAVALYESALAELGELWDVPVCLAGEGRAAWIALQVAGATRPARVSQVVAVDVDRWDCPTKETPATESPVGWAGWRRALPYGLALALARRGRIVLPQVPVERAASQAACDLVFGPDRLRDFRAARGEPGVARVRERGANVAVWTMGDAAVGSPELPGPADPGAGEDSGGDAGRDAATLTAAAVLGRALARLPG